MMNDLTQEQADRLAKWRWGESGYAAQHYFTRRVGDGLAIGNAWEGRTFAAAFRASMQSPMSDKDAELEARLRWGDAGRAWIADGVRHVGTALYESMTLSSGCGATWEQALEGAVDRTIRPRCVVSGPSHVSMTLEYYAEVLLPDLTQPEALTEAKAIWGERAYALPAVGTVACAVGCPGIARGEGATFRAALLDAACRALATAFGLVGYAAVRERNKAIGQAMMDPPEWAYPAAWRNSVMAAVEWASAQHTPVSLADWTDGPFEVLTTTLRAYHADRLTHCEQAARKRRGGGSFAAAVCAAYERGRLGGGR